MSLLPPWRRDLAVAHLVADMVPAGHNHLAVVGSLDSVERKRLSDMQVAADTAVGTAVEVGTVAEAECKLVADWPLFVESLFLEIVGADTHIQVHHRLLELRHTPAVHNQLVALPEQLAV